ncbi:hypothetical protein Tco_0512362, partial [Tanacetum coccineum]
IMEYLVNISKRRAFWSLNEDILKITILKTSTPYPSRKIRCICAYTHQRPQRNEDQYAVSRRSQHDVLKIANPTDVYPCFQELQTNTFIGSDHKDANEHIEKVLEIVDLFHIPNITIDQVMLRAFPMSLIGAASVIPSKTNTDAKTAIKEVAEYSQKWHNRTLRVRSTKTSDGLAAIQAQLKNLRREIKKLNEKVCAAQVGCEQCKGPHYTKDCPLKEEGKTLE